MQDNLIYIASELSDSAKLKSLACLLMDALEEEERKKRGRIFSWLL